MNNQLLAPDADLDESDLGLVRDVRETLRALLTHNAGGPPPDEATLAPLRTVASGGTARANLDSDGAVRLAAAGDSVSERLVELLLIVRDAQRDGTWARLRTCGNKLKNREFRARRRRSASS